MVVDKKLRLDLAYIKDFMESGTVSNVSWCPGSLQLANCMTKQGAPGYDLLQVIQTGLMGISKDVVG